jgi:hypothetical protein
MGAEHWRVLGFDARENAASRRENPLPTHVRERILLRPEIESPLSVDSHIWPTCFLFYAQMRMAGARTYDLLPAEPELGLWTSLKRMRAQLYANKRAETQIAIEVFVPDGLTLMEFPSPLVYSEAEPSLVPEGSTFLGYDVADAGFWSGLSNCGYTQEELDQLRPEWSKKINDFGLLESEEDALAFKDISDQRVPEHAPFWVFRLHQLPDN